MTGNTFPFPAVHTSFYVQMSVNNSSQINNLEGWESNYSSWKAICTKEKQQMCGV